MTEGQTESLCDEIARRALELGFDDVGYCSALPFDEWRNVANEAISRRILYDPRALMGEARSIVVAVRRYDVFDSWPEGAAPVANYYTNSTVGFERVKSLAVLLEERGYRVMANPSIPAKQAAIRAGMGTQGMNTQFCHAKLGILVSIHLILTDAPLADRDAPRRECVHCRRCVQACPTGAIYEGGFNREKCLRHLMASGSTVPEWARDMMGLRLTGCTDCQHACPRAGIRMAEVPQALAEACGIEGLLRGDAAQYETLAGYIGSNFARMKRIRPQAAICAGNSADRRYVPALAALLSQSDETLRSHAAWALGKLGGPEAEAALTLALAREKSENVRRELESALQRFI